MQHTDPRQRFDRNLRSLRDGLPTLRLIAMRKAQVVVRTLGHGTRAIAPLPLNMGAWQLLQDVEKLVDEMRRALRLPARGMIAETLLKGIIANEERLLARPDAPALMELTQQAAHRMDRMLDPPPETRMIGWCPGCGFELRCDDIELDSGWKACPRCGLAVRVAEVQQAAMLRLAVGGARGTAAAISRLLRPWGIDVKRNTIAQWDRRGTIRPIGREPDGSPVYLVWDVWQAHAARMGRKPAG